VQFLPSLAGLVAGIALALLDLGQAALWALAATGVFHSLFQKPQALCAKGGGCEKVLSSPYARPFGVPMEVLGAAWFIGVLPAYYLGAGQLWALIGIAGVAVLVAIEAKLRAFCAYCTVAHLIGLAAAALLLSA